MSPHPPRSALQVAALIAAAAPAPLVAQRRVDLWGVASATAAKARSRYPAGVEALSGFVLGGEGGASWGPVSLRVGYVHGSLDPDTVGPASRDHTEGFVLLGGRPVSGLEIAAGPHARAYVTSAGTQRWLFWELHARYETAIVRPLIHGYAELWNAVAGQVNVAEGFNSGRGGTAGIVFRPKGGRFALRLCYAIDETRLGSGKRRETVEGVTFAMGYGRW